MYRETKKYFLGKDSKIFWKKPQKYFREKIHVKHDLRKTFLKPYQG